MLVSISIEEKDITILYRAIAAAEDYFQWSYDHQLNGDDWRPNVHTSI